MFLERNFSAVTVSLVLETTPSLEGTLEASALTHASRRGLLARRSPLLKLQGDEHLIAMARAGNPGAFEMIVDRYQGRLLGFCRQMLGSTEDAADILQEVFVNAYRAMLADEREITLRPWLYRIARNRCLNHLRKPTADAQESMDMVPEVEAASTAEKVHNREEFRQIIRDANKLPETQRSALLLREMDALSYEEIAAAMETTVPSVKSLLVRAGISLAEASQARLLTCGEVRVELSEAAEGLRKVSSPVRRHVRECDECSDFRSQVRSNEKALAALFPVGGLFALKSFIASKLGLGSAGGAGSAGAASAGAGAGGRGGRPPGRGRRRHRRGAHRRCRDRGVAECRHAGRSARCQDRPSSGRSTDGPRGGSGTGERIDDRRQHTPGSRASGAPVGRASSRTPPRRARSLGRDRRGSRRAIHQRRRDDQQRQSGGRSGHRRDDPTGRCPGRSPQRRRHRRRHRRLASNSSAPHAYSARGGGNGPGTRAAGRIAAGQLQ